MINPNLVCKVSDNRDILVQFVGAEDFEDFVKRIKEKEENNRTTKV
jgi:tRNA U38,U39,U40 pseudouridine synthase TruA